MSTTSPEFGTDGNYAKCWIREDDGIYLYKTGSSRYEVEPLSEFLASQLAAILCPSYALMPPDNSETVAPGPDPVPLSWQTSAPIRFCSR